jgi:hypothetical protein
MVVDVAAGGLWNPTERPGSDGEGDPTAERGGGMAPDTAGAGVPLFRREIRTSPPTMMMAAAAIPTIRTVLLPPEDDEAGLDAATGTSFLLPTFAWASASVCVASG